MSIAELFSLTGRCALLTGATGHLGRAFARTLASQGAALVLTDRDEQALAALAAELRDETRCEVETLPCDLENPAAREAMVGHLLATRSALHVVVNNAAFVGTSDLQGWGVPFEQQSTETWRRAMEVNLTVPFELCRALSPLLRGSPGASVINISSIYGMVGPDWSLYEGTSMANPAAYAASKGGLAQLTRWLATTMAPAVRVNAISPGGISRGQPESFRARYEARTPLGRMAVEADFQGALAYLASDASAYVTGQNLVVDGGWQTW